MTNDQDSDAITRGIANILWALAWSDHVDEHGCCNLSGCEITHIMPGIPERAWRAAERMAGQIEGRAGSLAVLFSQAMKACGRPADYHGITAERFGECLAFEALGHGVSWYDDHPQFYTTDGKPFKCPYLGDDCDLRVYADSTCEVTP